MVAGSPVHNLLAYPLESNFNGVRNAEHLSSQVQSSTRSWTTGDQNFRPAEPTDSATPDMLRHLDRLNQGNAVDSSVNKDVRQTNRTDHESHRWWVLLDAAKACASKPPDLSAHRPAFVVRHSSNSFYNASIRRPSCILILESRSQKHCSDFPAPPFLYHSNCLVRYCDR